MLLLSGTYAPNIFALEIDVPPTATSFQSMEPTLLNSIDKTDVSITQADNWVKIAESNSSNSGIELLSSNIDQSTLQLSLDGFWYNEVETSLGKAWDIYSGHAASRLQKGSPALPIYSSSLIIPARAMMRAEVVDAKFVEYDDVLIAPSKGNLERTLNPADIAYEFGPQYQRDEFFPVNPVSMRDPYIIRDFRGQTVLFSPFVYNAVSKTLRVYYHIQVRIVADGKSTINTLPATTAPLAVDSRFDAVYNRQFINYQAVTSRYTPVEEDGNMLIISYGAFMSEMDPYIDWKIKTGTNVEIVDVASIGNAAQIKTYIADYYNDNGLTFVLLVGDAQQLPSSTIGGNDSDVDYSYIVGNDHYPDLFVGRFSAQTTEHVATQVQRTIDYERYPITKSGWYDDAIGIASDQGPGADNEFDYQHIRNISSNKLLPFTYSYAYELYDGSQSGEDENGNPTPAQVAAAINSGASIINYTGHGSNASWGTSGFSNNNVNALVNNDKLPFIISVACVNGNFVGTTCFAEAWLRAENNGEPSGAVAALMSTINQSWTPPMEGQDDMNDILIEADANNIKRTFGGITMNGCMAMNDAYGTDGEEMTDTWTIFGDPSLMVRTAIPSTMTVNHDSTVVLGDTSFGLHCDADYALAVLSMNGEIVGSAYVAGGTATIVFPPLSVLDTMDLVLTAFNYFPYESTVEIIPCTGPYVVYVTDTVNDNAGNANGLVDYNESILLGLELTNNGGDDAIGVIASIATNSEFISITDDNEVYGDVLVGDTLSISDGYAFDVDKNIPDGTIISFTLSSTDESGTAIWESGFSLTAHAPVLSLVSFTIDDSHGNNNGFIDPGEDAEISIKLTNGGSSLAFNVLGSLSSENEYITIHNNDLSYGDLVGRDTASAIFNITASEDAAKGANVGFTISFTADYGLIAKNAFNIYLGQKPVLILDFSSRVSSVDAMMDCFMALNVDADIENASMPTNLDIYKSVFVILGAYPDNHVLTNDEAGLLNTYLENGGRVYMEGGDTWAFDDQTSLHGKFMIEGIDDGSGDLSRIRGPEGSMLKGFEFEFDGVNNYIDRLAPLEDAQVILQNEAPEYATAISFENETYKTIGSSADFGGLVDEEGSSKAGLMAQYLYFFGIDFFWASLNENNKNDLKVNAFPNPFSNNVEIRLNISVPQNTEIIIYNLGGRRIKTLFSGELEKGSHSFDLDASKAKAGIYIYSVWTKDKNVVGKLMLTK